MKTLPPVPESIPKHILAKAKVAGMIYVGVGGGYLRSGPFGDRLGDRQEYCGRYDPKLGDFDCGWRGGTSPYAHYFTTPEIAAKYFTLPKKTPQILTRDAQGRFRGKKWALDEAEAKRKEGEEKSRRPKQGEVWCCDYGVEAC